MPDATTGSTGEQGEPKVPEGNGGQIPPVPSFLSGGAFSANTGGNLEITTFKTGALPTLNVNAPPEAKVTNIEITPQTGQEDTKNIIRNLKEYSDLRVRFVSLDKEITTTLKEYQVPNEILENLDGLSKAVKEIIEEINGKDSPKSTDLEKLRSCIKTFEDYWETIETEDADEPDGPYDNPSGSHEQVAPVVIAPSGANASSANTQAPNDESDGLVIETEEEKLAYDIEVLGHRFSRLLSEMKSLLSQTADRELISHLKTNIKKIEVGLLSLQKTPTKKDLDNLITLVNNYSADIADAKLIVLGEQSGREQTLRQSIPKQQTAPTPSPVPAPASSPAPKPAPDTTSPDNRTTSIESGLGLTGDQIFLTQPENIVRIEDTDKWMFVSQDGNSRHLEKDEENIWRMCQEEFARYEKNINEKTDPKLLEFYRPVIEAKMDLIDEIEKRGLRSTSRAGFALHRQLDELESGELAKGTTPDNKAGAPTSFENLTEEQVYVVYPKNIFYDENFVRKGGAIRAKGKSKGAWVINGYGNKSFNPEPLHSQDFLEWKNCMFELERYADFIKRIPKEKLGNYTPVIKAKMDLIKTLQQDGFAHAREFGVKLNEMLNRAMSGEFDTPEPAVKDSSVEKNSVLEKISLTITPDKNDPFYQEQELCRELIKSYNEYVDKIGAVFRTPEYQKMFLRDLIENKNNFVTALEDLAVGKIKATREAFGKSLLFWSNEYQTVWNEYISITTKLDERGIVADVAFSQSSKGGYNWHVDMKENGSTTFPYGASLSDKKYWKKIEGDFLNPEKADDIHLAKISLKETSGKKIWYFKNEKGEELELTKENGLSQEECSQIVSLLSAFKNYLKSNEVKRASDSEIKLKKELIDCLNEGKFDEAKKVSEELRAHLYGGVVTVKHPHWDPVTQQKVYVETKHKFDGMVKIFEDEAKKNTAMLENLNKGYTLTPYGTEFAYFKYPLFSKEGTFVADRSSGKWMKLSEEDTNYFSRANSAIIRFKLDKPIMVGFITLKNKVIQLVNDYKFKEAADAAHEYLRLSKLPVDQLPSDFDKTTFTGTLGSVTSVPSGSPATTSGGEGGTPPVPPPPSGPPAPPPPPSDPPTGPLSPDDGMDKAPLPPILRMSLDGVVRIVSTQPGQRTSGEKILNGVYVNEKGAWSRISENEEIWRAVISMFNGEVGVKGLYTRYISFFESGSFSEKREKRTRYANIISRENDLVRLVQNKNIREAYAVCEILENELAEAEEEWKQLRPDVLEAEKKKAERGKEQADLQKKWEEEEKVHNQVLEQANQIKYELTSDLERQHVTREETKYLNYYKQVKDHLDALQGDPTISFDTNLITNYQNARAAFNSVLTMYEDKLNKLGALKLEYVNPNDKEDRTRRIKDGAQILRPTRLTAIKNGAILHQRGGKGPVDAKKWVEEQEAIRNEKQEEAKRTADVVNPPLDSGIPLYRANKYSEYNQDPVAFVIKHLDKELVTILTKEQRDVINGILEKVPDEVFAEASALIKRRSKGVPASSTARAGMTRQVFSPMTPDEKEDKRVLQEIKAEKTLSNEELLARRSEERPIDASQTDPSYATLTGRMVESKNAPLESMSRERLEAVNAVSNKRAERAKGNWWRIIGFALVGAATALGVGSYVNRGPDSSQVSGVSAPGSALDQTRLAPDTLTGSASAQDRQPMGWRDYLLKENSPEFPSAPEFRRKILKDFEEMSTEEFLVEHLPSLVSTSNPSSIQKVLGLDAYTVRSGQDPLPDISDRDRKILADIISEIQQLYIGTQAPILAGDAKGEVDTSAYYINQPSYNNKKITIGDYFAMFKAAKYAADTRDRAQLGKKY